MVILALSIWNYKSAANNYFDEEYNDYFNFLGILFLFFVYTKFNLSYIFLFSAIVMIASKARHSMLKIHVAVEAVVARVRRSFKVYQLPQQR